MQIQAVQKLSSNEQPSDDDISNNPEVYYISIVYSTIIILLYNRYILCQDIK